MAWIAITEADVLTVLSGAELTAYRAAALAAGQADPVQPTIDQVTDLVRGYVGGCARNLLGEGATIPSKLLAVALDLIAVRIPLRVGRDPKAGRKDAGENAIALLKEVAACRFIIEEPLTVSTELTSNPRPNITAPCRQFAAEGQDGF